MVAAELLQWSGGCYRSVVATSQSFSVCSIFLCMCMCLSNGGNGLLLLTFGSHKGCLRALNALTGLRIHDERSYKSLSLYFCNSFFLAFNWPLENNRLLIAFKLHDGRSYMV